MKKQRSLPDFLHASGTGAGVGTQFDPDQLSLLHRLHAYLQQEGILSDLSFEYRHHICRASFNLTNSGEDAPVTAVRLTEHRVSPGQWRYMVDTVVDGLPKSINFVITMAERGMNEHMLAILAARAKAENTKFFGIESGAAAHEFQVLLSKLGRKPS